MLVQIIAVGKIKEEYLRKGITQYSQEITRYQKFEIIEVADEPAQEKLSRAEEEQVRLKEGEKILRQVKEDSFVILLDIQGKNYSSAQFADKINSLTQGGKEKVTFVIGGSLGLGENVLSRADFRLSFSPMTFPHQLMRLILVEQLYRALGYTSK